MKWRRNTFVAARLRDISCNGKPTSYHLAWDTLHIEPTEHRLRLLAQRDGETADYCWLCMTTDYPQPEEKHAIETLAILRYNLGDLL